MNTPHDDGEATVRVGPDGKPLSKPKRTGRSGATTAAGICALAVVLAAGVGWLVWPTHAPPAPATPQPPPQAVAPVPKTEAPVPTTLATAPATASVEQIRRNDPSGISVFRLAENPRVLVLDFASLAEQGRMLDRIAALTEKAGLPRDRIIDTKELSEAIHKEGGPDPWFYYGHDYSAASLARFFTLADSSGITLTQDELRLRRIADQAGLLDANSRGALISVPRVGADSNVSAGARDAILTHELSHGEYFTNPDYARHVHQFWSTTLTEAERAAFRTDLERQGYDRGNLEVMENEAHAYLLFTPDPRFFLPSQVGISPDRRADLRAAFLRDMPQGWLRTILETLP